MADSTRDPAQTAKEHEQVGGDHYRSEITPFEVIDAWGLDFYRASALKYIMRAGNKPGASAGEDLRKAAHYLREAADRADLRDSQKTEQTAAPEVHRG